MADSNVPTHLTAPEDAALDSGHDTLSIVVKNVYHPFETQRFEVEPRWTIAQLKQRLTRSLPTHPTLTQQKLICSGRICSNEQELQAIAKLVHGSDQDEPNKVPIVFHLMLPGVPKPTTPAPRAEPKIEAKTESKTEPAPAMAQAENLSPASAATSASVAAALEAEGAAKPSAASLQATQYQMYMQLMMLQQQTMVLAQIQYLQQLQAQLQVQNVPESAASPSTTTTPTTNPAPQHPDPYQMAMNFGAMANFGQIPVPLAPGAANLPGLAGVANMAAQANIAQAPVGAGVEAAAAAVAAAVPPVVAPRFGRLQEVWALLDLRMALKMAFMLFILGQDLPTNRLILLSTMVIAVYLYFTGILKKLLELVRPRAQQADAAAAGPEGAQVGINYPALENASRFLRISAERGFWKDLGSFCGGLLLSLAPAWHPQPMQNQVDNADPAENAIPEMDMGNLQGI